MSQAKNINKISERELESGILKPELSWHNEYKDRAYVYIGGLNRDLTEADILTIFSQYGIPVDIYLVRDRFSGESRGFAYLKYEDQRSTILAVDNLNGVAIAGKTIQVDHTFYEPRNDNIEYRNAVENELAKDKLVEPHPLVRNKKEDEQLSITKGFDDDLADPMAHS